MWADTLVDFTWLLEIWPSVLTCQLLHPLIHLHRLLYFYYLRDIKEKNHQRDKMRSWKKRRGRQLKTILVVTSLQSPERTLNLDTVKVDMFLLHGTVRTEIVLDTGAPIVCQVPLYLSACNHFLCLWTLVFVIFIYVPLKLQDYCTLDIPGYASVSSSFPESGYRLPEC